MNIVFSNETQNLAMDSYGMYLAESNAASACEVIASCDTNFDN